MLSEIKNVRQFSEEGYRRWFMDGDMDLILWYEEEQKELVGFQISYDKRSVQRTVTWKSSGKNGQGGALTCDGPYNRQRLVRLLKKNSGEVEKKTLDFLLARLEKKGE